jgi:hypothetical protein
MSAAPGQVFVYDSGAPTILAAILQKTTGQSPLQFAQVNLFGPLGISDVGWKTDQNGLERGGAGIQLKPRDMAKFGYLYLRNGLWEGKQILPASWVNDSFEKHIDPKMEEEKRSGYGYLWWLQTYGVAAAQGLGGQYILLSPAQDLEVVFTSGLSPQEFQMPYDLFESYVLLAAKSSVPLAANSVSATRLEKLLSAAAYPEPKPVLPLPPVAQRISDKTFLADDPNNPTGIQSFSFAFQKDSAVVNTATRGGGRGQWQIGLDGVYRVNSNMIGMEAARGVWEDEKTLVLYFVSLSGQTTTTSTFAFAGDSVVVSVASNIYPSLSVSGKAHLQE